MRFLENTDILVAEMPSSVFADMRQASDIIEKKITHKDPEEVVTATGICDGSTTIFPSLDHITHRSCL